MSARKKRKVSRLPESSIIVQNVDTPLDGIPPELAKMYVQFEINEKPIRVNIHTPLKVIEQTSENENILKQSVNKMLNKCREAVAKLPVASFREIDNYDVADAPPLPNSYIRFIERSMEELDGEVEYDMDEEDSAWLEMMNENRAKSDLPAVSVDTFELLMDRLEKESYFLVQMNKEVDSSLAVIDDEAVCSICLDGECQNSNVILFCDMCNLAVHQDCYGVPYIPEGHWLCRRCLHSPSAPVDCVLCPNNGGAFKQTDRAHWAHIVCALWIPEVRFANTVFLEPIDSIEAIPAARWRLTCYICKQKGVGACIQCHKTNCYSAFHVTCAQQAGLYMKMETVKDGNLGAILVQKIAYCDVHTPADAETKPKMKEKTPSPMDKMKNARRVLAKKRSVAPVISIPTIPPERIQEIASLVSLPKKAFFMQRLIGYWTLKRQFRNGVPLLRRLQTFHSAKRESHKDHGRLNDVKDLNRQVKYWQTLRQDLERARLLCELVRKREKLKKELINAVEKVTFHKITPFNRYLKKIVEMIKERDTGEVFFEPVDVNEVPDYPDFVTDPMDLRTMDEKAENFEYDTLDDLEKDFQLMIENCLAYNSKETVFYRAGVRLREQGSVIFQKAKAEFHLNNFDLKTGLIKGQENMGDGGIECGESSIESKETPIECTPVEQDQALEIDKELASISDPNNVMDDNDLECKLLQLLEKSKAIKHKGARMKRVRSINIQIANMKRKNKRLLKAQTPACNSFEKSEPSITDESRKKSKDVPKQEPGIRGDGKRNLRKIERKEDPKPNSIKKTPVEDKKCPMVESKKVEKCVESDSESERPSKRRRLRKSTASKSPIPNSASFRVYRSKETPVESDNESGSEEDSSDDSSCSSCSGDDSGSTDDSSGSSSSSSASSSTSSSSSDDEEEEDDEGEDSLTSSESDDDDSSDNKKKGDKKREALEMFQLVWAKLRGFTWYPALIINPEMPKGYIHNGILLPSPPEDVLASAIHHTDPVYLVMFYDKKRTWHWLPRTKLEPLGVNEDLDKFKLKVSKKVSERKAVQKAYKEAMLLQS